MSITDFLTSKTYKTILNDALSRVPDDLDKREGSVIMTAIAPACYQLALGYLKLAEAVKQCYGSTATGDNLTELGNSLGIERREGECPYVWVKFKRGDVVQPTANPENWIDDTFYFKMSDGVDWYFTITNWNTDDDDEYIFKCLSDREGYIDTLRALRTDNTIYSLYAVAGCTFDTDMTLTDDVNYGVDDESDEAFRSRYIEYLKFNRFGGNYTDYQLLPERASSLASGSDALGNYDWRILCKRYQSSLIVLGGFVKDYKDSHAIIPTTLAEMTAIKNELDPDDGDGTGLLPFGHNLFCCSPLVVTLTAVYTVTGNTIDKSIIADELLADAKQYFYDKNIEGFKRNDDGSYPTFVVGWSDFLTIWGRCYRSGYGNLSSLAAGLEDTTSWTDLSGKVSAEQFDDEQLYIFPTFDGSINITVS